MDYSIDRNLFLHVHRFDFEELMRALVIEDDTTMAALTRRLLEDEGFGVDVAVTGEAGQAQAMVNAYDAIVLDLRLPDTHGVTVLQKLRCEKRDTPVLVLTADDDEASTVRALDAGADDYLSKPFKRDVFRARIRALVRRGGARRTEVLTCGNVVFNRLSRKAIVEGREMRLMPKELALLEHMLLHRDEVITRTSLLESVWDLQFDPGTNVVDVNVARLRKKMEQAGATASLSTRRGVGYVLESTDDI